ncbi:MAG: alpha-L-rhamnosidase N-terminal domain-containing protein [Pyrinomonadaceae bacterium]
MFAPEKINPELLTKAWSARWVTVPGGSPVEYGIYHFRRMFELGSRPASFVVHVTGDNRYQLFVNGQRVAAGPARGDLNHWKFETLDLAPYLRNGKNVLAAVVWNYGRLAPEAQLTNQTGFLLQGDAAIERTVDTNASWKCVRNEAYAPLPVTHGEMRGYFVAGPGERIDGARYPWDWQEIEYDDSAWTMAQVVSPGAPRDARDAPNRWMLVPRDIPLMEERPERILSVRQASGTVTVPTLFRASQSRFKFRRAQIRACC